MQGTSRYVSISNTDFNPFKGYDEALFAAGRQCQACLEQPEHPAQSGKTFIHVY